MSYRTRQVLIIGALIVVSLFTINFAVRAFDHGRRFRARTDEPIQPWMNVPYIARAYRVRPEVVGGAIGLAPEQRDRRPIQEIASEQGRTPQQLIDQIKAAIEQERAGSPGRPRPPGPKALPSNAPENQP